VDFKTGEPQDPWGRQLEMPFERLDGDNLPDGQTIVFQAGNKPARAEVGKLVKDFTETLKRPYVTLTSDVPTPEDSGKRQPQFIITGHSDDETEILEFDAGLNPPVYEDGNTGGDDGDKNRDDVGKDDDRISTGPAKKNADIDDDIPF
jgi:hypothetical protein